MSETVQELSAAERARIRNREYMRRKRQENPEASDAAMRRYREKHREAIAARRRERRLSDETLREYDRKSALAWNAANPARVLLRNCVKRSRERNHPAPTITVEWIEGKLAKGVCEVTGLPFDTRPPVGGAKRPFAPSVDRLKGAEGYSPENCRMVVAILNYARNEFSDADLLTLAKALCNPSASPKGT